METLVVVNEHRNHHEYYSRAKAYKPARFGYSPPNHFGETNCRSFQSGAGILPTPLNTRPTPVIHHIPSSAFQKTPSPTIKTRSLPVPVSIPTKCPNCDDELGIISENSPFSERWAGPAYSNSPPPSCLPIPKFSVRPKRTVSLELPVSDSGIKEDLMFAKSSPTSPTREHDPSAEELFLNVDAATKMLCRILNLDG